MTEAAARVSTHSIRYRILKDITSSAQQVSGNRVSTHSIRYRILKVTCQSRAVSVHHSFNPFDPIQDTESRKGSSYGRDLLRFQPIRSDTGY